MGDLITRGKTESAIVLVGMMGAGKTSVGTALAALLGLPFVDTDAQIEAETGLSVREIFEQEGEAGFRRREETLILRLLEVPQARVLALGGGAFMNPSVRAKVAQGAMSVWLRAAPKTLVGRCADSATRPLLEGSPPSETLETILKHRESVYAQADVTVDTDTTSCEETAHEVVRALAL